MDQFTGTKAVAERHAFDIAALQAYLERELPGFLTGPQRYRPLYQVMKDAGVKIDTLRAYGAKVVPIRGDGTMQPSGCRLPNLPIGTSIAVHEPRHALSRWSREGRQED